MKSAEGASSISRNLALIVGVGMLAGAGYVGLSGGAPVVATILVLIGASVLSGWVRACRKN